MGPSFLASSSVKLHYARGLAGLLALVAAGNIVVVPAQTPHGFACEGDETLRVMSVHPSPAVEQVNLEE